MKFEVVKRILQLNEMNEFHLESYENVKLYKKHSLAHQEVAWQASHKRERFGRVHMSESHSISSNTTCNKSLIPRSKWSRLYGSSDPY